MAQAAEQPIDSEARGRHDPQPAAIATHNLADGLPLAAEGVSQPPVEHDPSRPTGYIPGEKVSESIMTASCHPVGGNIEGGEEEARCTDGQCPVLLE